MKKSYITGIALLLVLSCGDLDSNSFDERSPNYTSPGTLLNYVNTDNGTTTITTAKPQLNNVDIAMTSSKIILSVECTLQGCSVFDYRTSPNGGTTTDTKIGLRNGVSIEIPKNPTRANEYWIDCQCVIPDTSHWAGWTRLSLN